MSSTPDVGSAASQKRKAIELIADGTMHIKLIASTFHKKAKVEMKERQLKLAEDSKMPDATIASIRNELFEMYNEM
jgi:hypothetical protein